MISRGDSDGAKPPTGPFPASYISVDGSTIFSTMQRGVTSAILTPNNCSLSNIANFDTYASYSNTTALMSYVSNLPVCTLILGITYDEPELRFSPAYPLFQSELGINLTTLQYRGKFAFMAVIGYPVQTVWSLLPPGGDPVHLTVIV